MRFHGFPIVQCHSSPVGCPQIFSPQPCLLRWVILTSTSLIYVFRVMTCEAFYDKHPEPPPGFMGDRCTNREIEASTSKAVALLSASTTAFGVINLFVAGWSIKKFGVKHGLLIQVFWPAVRLAVQNIGVATGGERGILIVQASQIITIVGGPAGYFLALNTYITEISEHEERTGALGRLQGCTMFGTAIAYLAGGLISDAFGIIAPFRVTLVLFLSSCVYILFFLPWIPKSEAVASKASKGITRFFGPLKTFAPQKWVLPDGRIQTQYGALLLGAGVFLGVLATGYIPVLLQMYSTDEFGFGTTENGYLISMYCLLRGLFLTLAFPRIISAGRKWVKKRDTIKNRKDANFPDTAIPDLPTDINDFAAVEAIDHEEEPVEPPKRSEEKETFAFDLMYCQYSLVVDGILTAAAGFVSQGWQIYLVAAFLPFASGTGSASKGTILQMCPPSERTDALSGITLLEMIARLSTSKSKRVPSLHRP
jgi:MFS family permease